MLLAITKEKLSLSIQIIRQVQDFKKKDNIMVYNQYNVDVATMEL